MADIAINVTVCFEVYNKGAWCRVEFPEYISTSFSCIIHCIISLLASENENQYIEGVYICRYLKELLMSECGLCSLTTPESTLLSPLPPYLHV